MRKTPFINGQLYHIYNRGVDKRKIFSVQQDMARFFRSMKEFNVITPIGSLYENSFRFGNRLGGETAKSENKKKSQLVNFICYCLNPNHHHFILEQVIDNGISEFMKRMGGYTWYFNNKYKRSGSLFQGLFKSVHINSNEYLLHLSVYINLNNLVHKLGKKDSKLVKTSWDEYIGKSNEVVCKKDIVLDQFKNFEEYRNFAKESLPGILDRKKQEKELADFLLE